MEGTEEATGETLEAKAVEETADGRLNVGKETVDVEDRQEASELLEVDGLGEDAVVGELREELAGESGDGVVTLDTTEKIASETLEETAVEKAREDGLNVGEEAVDVEDLQETSELLNADILEDAVLSELRKELVGEAGDGVVTLEGATEGLVDGVGNTTEEVTLTLNSAGDNTVDGLAGAGGDTLNGVAKVGADVTLDFDISVDTEVEELALVLTLGELRQLSLNLLELCK